MKKIIIIFLIALFPIFNFSQEKELFDLIIADENATPELLPERMIFTQRIFWGENGILRKTGIAPLNLKNREKELKLRRSFLKTHQNSPFYLPISHRHCLLLISNFFLKVH